jgi:hypothetical protein
VQGGNRSGGLGAEPQPPGDFVYFRTITCSVSGYKDFQPERTNFQFTQFTHHSKAQNVII